MAKTSVFIDGSNFYFKLKELSHRRGGAHRLLDFQFGKFAQWLAASHQLVEVHYYLGAVKQIHGNEKSETLYADQQKLIRRLQAQKVAVTLGHIIRHPDGSFHEKGVDVRLAVEMIRYARLNAYDIAYLLCSDTDLVPAVEEVRSFGKKVQYVGIPKGQSFGLTVAADDVRLLRPEDIVQFFPSSPL